MLMVPDYRLLRDPRSMIQRRRPVGRFTVDYGMFSAPLVAGFICKNGLQSFTRDSQPLLQQGGLTNKPQILGNSVFFSKNIDPPSNTSWPCFSYKYNDNTVSWVYQEIQAASYLFDIILVDDGSSGLGPILLIEEGGVTHGLSIIYRTAPDKYSFFYKVSNTSYEVQFSTVFQNNDYTRRRLCFVHDGVAGVAKMFVDGSKIDELAIPAGAKTIPAHTSEAGVFGMSNDYDSNGNYVSAGSSPASSAGTTDPFYGYAYGFARFGGALHDAEACSLTRDPYQFLIPA